MNWNAMLRWIARPLMAAAVLGGAFAAQAAEPVEGITPAFGNTVLVTYPDGHTNRIWFLADGKWDGQSRHGYPRAGRWSLRRNGGICLKQSQPPTLPISFCTSFPGPLRIGLHWDSKDLLGRSVTMSLLKGVVPLAESASGAAR